MATEWLATPRDVSKLSSIYIDGDLFAASDGELTRFVSGKSDGWDAALPDDTLLRPAPVYSLVAGGLGTDRRTGWIYAYDKPNARIVALDKSTGTYRAQYRLAGGIDGWDDMRSFYVVPGVDEAPATLIWISSDGLHQSVLEAVPDVAPAASPSASPTASGSPGTSAKPSAKASAAP